MKIRRSLIGISAATSLGLGLVLTRRWSRSEAAAGVDHGDIHEQWHIEVSSSRAQAPADVELPLLPPVLVVSPCRRWSGCCTLVPPCPPLPLQDYLHAAAESTSQAGQTLAHCLRSARAAWERRQLASVESGGAVQRPSSAVLLADFLTELHEGWGAAQRPAPVVFDQLSEWLLERATAQLVAPAEQRATQRYLAAALRSEGAEALLARPGAAPRLLQLAAMSAPLQQLLAAALARCAPPQSVPAEDVADVLRLLGAATQQLRHAHRAGGATRSRMQQRQAEVALQLLLAWARASPANATCLAEAGAGPQLADLAAFIATGTGVDGMQTKIAEARGARMSYCLAPCAACRVVIACCVPPLACWLTPPATDAELLSHLPLGVQLMGTLARQAAASQALHMGDWLYPLLCLAADAAANSQWQLAGVTLTTFAACLLRGCELRVSPPLLRHVHAHRSLMSCWYPDLLHHEKGVNVAPWRCFPLCPCPPCRRS